MKNHPKNSAILLCGHGSRSKSYSKNLSKIKEKIENSIKISVFNCFLEINKPSLDECLLKYSDKYDKIFIFPFLIFEGKHFKEDVKEILEKYNGRFKNITLIKKISLLNEILPVTFKILKKKITKNKNTFLITSSSYNKNKSVYLSLKKYTEVLSKKLKLKKSFFHYVGDENKINKKLDLISNEKFSILLHPIFFFDGYLYSKNTKYFRDIFTDKVLITNPLINEEQIFEIILKKLVDTIFRKN